MNPKRTLHILRPGSKEPVIEAGDMVFRIGGPAAGQTPDSGKSPEVTAETLVKLVFECDLVVTW